MKWKSIPLVGILVIVLLFTSCVHKTKSTKASVRIAQFLVSQGPVHISITPKKETAQTLDLEYANVSQDMSLKPGTYTVSIYSSEKNLLLRKEIGVGVSGHYIFALVGIPMEGQQVNEHTLMNRLHKITEGEAAKDPNAFLPELLVFNEEYYGSKEKSQSSWTHAAPGLAPLSAHAVLGEKDSISLHKTTYPKTASATTLKPGEAKLYWTLGTKNRIVARKTMNIEAKTSYRHFIIPFRENYGDSLQVISIATRNAPIK